MDNHYARIDQLYFIWNADWSIRGAIDAARDFVKGVESCALCEIAYSGVVQKSEWKECNASIPAPVTILYKNKVPEPLLRVADGMFPVVIVETDGTLRRLLEKDDIEACQGSVNAFKTILEQKIAALS